MASLLRNKTCKSHRSGKFLAQTHLVEGRVLSQFLDRENVEQLVHCRVLGVRLQLRHRRHP